MKSSELTKREIEVMQLLANGLTERQIANELFIAYKTVKNHKENAYRKIGCHNKGEAVAYCFRKGLIK